MSRVVALVTDLMDRSRIDAAVPDGVLFVRDATEVAEHAADIVVADLRRVDDPRALRNAVPNGRIIVFGSHIDEQGMDAVRAAGVEVLPRSVFFRRLGELLA